MNYSKARRLQQAACMSRGESDRVSIEWNAAHHVTRTGVPRVVFPESEIATWFQRVSDVLKRLTPIAGRNVVENAVSISEIKTSGGIKLA